MARGLTVSAAASVNAIVALKGLVSDVGVTGGGWSDQGVGELQVRGEVERDNGQRCVLAIDS